MFVLVAVRKVKSMVLFIFSLIWRCFCCFHKRWQSDVHLPISVTEDGNAYNPNSAKDGDGLGGWDSWDAPSSVVSDGVGRTPQVSLLQQQINQYRLNQQRKMKEPPPEAEPEPNYFEDLKPTIDKKQQMVILERPEEEQHISNRLSFSLTDPLLQSSELGEWEEDGGGWEGEADEDINLDVALREKRLKEREWKRQEQQRRKAEKDAARNSKLASSKIATKIS